jgi:hypothetical protein
MRPLICPVCQIAFVAIDPDFVSKEAIEVLLEAHWEYDCEMPLRPAKIRFEKVPT